MTYTANVPVTGQSLGSSRPIINTNFGLIQSVFDANHQDFNKTNPGFHTFVDMLAQSSDAAPPTGCIAHYCKLDSNSISQWYFQRENSGAVIQMSSGPSTKAGAYPSTTGQTFLPGGLQLKWGYGTVGAGATNALNFTMAPLSLSAFSTAGLTGMVVSQTQNAVLSVTGLTTTTISITAGTGQGASFMFWAIGN